MSPESGKYLQFTFHVDKDDGSPISSCEAEALRQHLVGEIRRRGFGFDGVNYLGNEWKDGQLQRLEKKED